MRTVRDYELNRVDFLLVLVKEFKQVGERYNKATIIGTKEHDSNKHIKERNGRDSRIYEIHPCISPYRPAKKRPLKKASCLFS